MTFNSPGMSSTSGSQFGKNEGWNDSFTHNDSYGTSQSLSGGSQEGMQEHRDYAVEPHEFSTDLLSGGVANGKIVSGVVVLPGRTFQRNGKHWMQIGFAQ
jgi:hypothetical protein